MIPNQGVMIMNRGSPVELPEEYLDFYKNLETCPNTKRFHSRYSPFSNVIHPLSKLFP
jgi:hypothetical protein